MVVVKSVNELKKQVGRLRDEHKSIGFVPTMGALHQGHLQLVSRCVAENDACVVSLFINPTQFNDKNDFNRYPRTLENDIALLASVGCAIVFAPSAEEMYTPSEMETVFDFDFGGLDEVMEGIFRPGHFNGVVQVVSKLFSLVTPDKAYFGEKDFQQLAIIRRMVQVMIFPIEIVGCPIVREKSGLALSSRNALLSEQERTTAAVIYRTLSESKQLMHEKTVAETKAWVIDRLNAIDGLKVEYYEIVNGNSLQSITDWSDADYVVGCVTVYCGKVRLIDNINYK
ncbi:MAG TPA: pantoate--beta-alanine ligase [Paludibacteraceae bacterium]|jgi:pantoate--beta-alanine ligase|nr:pantoate--beta-alanine ligase [Bacteroidales bacterium]HOA45875.1 pantoate--beta-alanine ligase [Paludibacteraceae bacterium]HPD27512.1 pantoate--beta-alanine ligase [Paludibacteraceae bacterium]HRR58275.1 pantoate--beta-alanine ligase [Paludibacteraceae bacterium]HRU73180.1 pantoate--beta-alanine ligase [Paludibacteraceae bacterium]